MTGQNKMKLRRKRSLSFARENSAHFGRLSYQSWVKWDTVAFKLGFLKHVMVPKLKSAGTANTFIHKKTSELARLLLKTSGTFQASIKNDHLHVTAKLVPVSTWGGDVNNDLTKPLKLENNYQHNSSVFRAVFLHSASEERVRKLNQRLH